MSETVLITGTNRGIGLELVREFLKHDYHVMATCRHPGTARELTTIADTSPDALTVIQMELTDPDSVEAALYEISTRVKHLDILINNAGVFPEEGNESFLDLNLDWFDDAFRTNVTGTARVIRAALPLLRKAGNPRIANISSGAGSISDKNDSLRYCYGTSKAALNMFTRTLAAELKLEGIPVVAISPGWVQTDMGGPQAQITPGESAATLFETTTGLHLNQTGTFMGRDGNSTGYDW